MKDPSFPTGIPRLIQLLLVFTWIALLIGALISPFQAFEALRFSNEEANTQSICKLPSEVLYDYFIVARSFAPGAIIGGSWLKIYHYGNDREIELERLREYGFSDSFLAAEAKGFNLHLSNQRPQDKDILLTIKQLKEDCSESHRRSDFQERFKDFLQKLGQMVLFALGAWISYKLGSRFNKSET